MENNMRSFSDLTLGRVISADPRSSNRFGWLEVLDDQTGQPTGRTIWFHFAEGHYTRISDDGVVWDGSRRGINVLRDPRVGDFLVITVDLDRQGRQRASAWTYADPYYEQCVEYQSRLYRIILTDITIDGEPVVVWQGLVCDYYDTRPNSQDGSPPKALVEGMVVQVYVDQDEVEDGWGGGTILPGHWEDVSNSEQALKWLQAMAKRPWANSHTPPPLRVAAETARQHDERLFRDTYAQQELS